MWSTKSGKSKDTYDWTSLRGSDKRKMLKKLPPKIPSLLPPVNGDRVKELWEVYTFSSSSLFIESYQQNFQSIMEIIGEDSPTEEAIENLEIQVIIEISVQRLMVSCFIS